MPIPICQYQYANTNMPIPIYQYANMPIPICQYQYANMPMPICQYANMPICQYANMPIYQYANTPICQYQYANINMPILIPIWDRMDDVDWRLHLDTCFLDGTKGTMVYAEVVAVGKIYCVVLAFSWTQMFQPLCW